MKIKARESQNVEYKSSWNDKYLEWICGFANAQGAVMYFGVNDDHEVIGLKNVDKLMEDIPNKVINYMGIVVDVNLHELDGLEYIEVVIEPSNVPISYRGKYYYRSGSTMQEMNGPALQNFVIKKMGRSWDDVPNDRATINDIDRNAIDYFLKKGIEAERISEDEKESSTEDVLKSLHLMNADGSLKNAALLLFGKDPLNFFTSVQFKIGRFGTDEADLILQDVIEGNIIQMADRVVQTLKNKYLALPVHFEGMQRREKLEIPESALREILYNAIAHKDYTGPAIQMHVYNDHVEIWNYGNLPDGYTEEKLYSKHASQPRNRNIADTMFKAGFIDTWGRGYKKIKEGFDSVGIPMPTVENADGGVRVSFHRGFDVVSGKPFFDKFLVPERESGQTVVNVLSERQRLIIKSIIGSVVENDRVNDTVNDRVSERVNDRVNAISLARHFGVSESTIRRDLAYLQKCGIIKRVGSDKTGHWVIVTQEADGDM